MIQATRRNTLKVAAGALLITGFSSSIAMAQDSSPSGFSGGITLKPGVAQQIRGKSEGTSQKVWTKIRLPQGAETQPLSIRSQTRYQDSGTNISALLYAHRGQWRVQVEKYVRGAKTVLWASQPVSLKPLEEVTLELSARGDVHTLLNLELRQSDGVLVSWSGSLRTDPELIYPLGTVSTLYLGRSASSEYSLGASQEQSTWDAPEPRVEGWGEPVFEDRFEGSSVDLSKWRVRDRDYVGYDWGYYFKDNVKVNNGNLVISMRKMDKPITTKDGKTRAYSEGYIDSIGKHSIENGRWEMRAKLPCSPEISAGLWGGFWLRPDNTSIQGEIDIAEAYGSKTSTSKTTLDPSNRYEATCHFDQTGKNKAGKLSPAGSHLKQEWHIYAVEKTPESITFFFDGTPFHTVTKAQYGDRFTKAFPPGAKWNMRLNFQAGSSYWGQVEESTDLNTADIVVDYIKVWDYNNKEK